MAKVKGKKMDANLVSTQKWEIDYIAKKFNCLPIRVRQARKACGRSRKKRYDFLRLEP